MFGGGSNNNKKEEEATPYGFTVDWSMEPNVQTEQKQNSSASFGGTGNSQSFGGSAGNKDIQFGQYGEPPQINRAKSMNPNNHGFGGSQPLQQQESFGGSSDFSRGSELSGMQQQPTGFGGQQMSASPSSTSMAYTDASQFLENCSSVKECAYQENRNQKFRQTMEDAHVVIDNLGGDPSCGIFAIFDGHGGRQVSDHCQERFPTLFTQELRKKPYSLEQPIKDVFTKVDNELRLLDSDGCGSTACVCVIRVEQGERVLYTANLGDSRAVLFKANSGQAQRLTNDHTPKNSQEKQRIQAEGGIIINDRVGGTLAVSRAFGDHSLKKCGLSCIPEMMKYTLSQQDTHLIVGCDGVWDVLQDDEACLIAAQSQNTLQGANKVVQTALQKGSTDNISCIVVKL